MHTLTTAWGYAKRIDRYFELLRGEYHMEETSAKSTKDKDGPSKQKIWDREPEPPTLCGLALFLGFNSRHEFEAYERNGEFAAEVKRGRLMIEAEYEKKLHYQSPTGAIFALKSLGWTERTDGALLDELPRTFEIKVIDSGPLLAANEKEVAA